MKRLNSYIYKYDIGKNNKNKIHRENACNRKESLET